jgi:CDP-glycerol glycerophosphotransferase (TagB/SpsB family)
LILFTARLGTYNQNSRFLFEEFVKTDPKGFKYYYLLRDRDEYKRLSFVYKDKILYTHSFIGFLHILRAQTIAVTHGSKDVSPFYKPRPNKILQLWHAVSFKKLGFLDKNMSFWQRLRLKSETRDYGIFISSSEIEQYALSCCYRIPPEKILITGYPRNDQLVNKQRDKTLLVEHPYLGSQIVLFAPTFRDEGITSIFPFTDLCMSSLNQFLQEMDAYLLLRVHINELDKIKLDPSFERILPADASVFPEGQELLPHVDILITDYSSIFIDFLLLNRPILFIPYDLEDYQTTRGLLYNYNNMTPGPKVFTQADLISHLEGYLRNPESDREIRAHACNMYHSYKKGHSSETIINFLRKSIKNTIEER